MSTKDPITPEKLQKTILLTRAERMVITLTKEEYESYMSEFEPIGDGGVSYDDSDKPVNTLGYTFLLGCMVEFRLK